MQRYSPRYSNFGHPAPDSAGDYVLYAEAQAEINDLKALLAESTKVHEDMKLGGNKLAESLRSAKARIEDLEAEINALQADRCRLAATIGNQPATPQEEEECQHEYSYESMGPYHCLWVCKKCGEVLDED